jgi:hypothetical protein
MIRELTFGIYPLSAAGTPFGLAVGPEDNYHMIEKALTDLKGDSKSLNPRLYLIYTRKWESKMLALADRYHDAGLLADLALGCGDWTDSDTSVELESWLNFIEKVIDRYGSDLTSLQITNEPNLSFMEGSKPYIMQVLTEGVLAAKKIAVERKLALPIGFGSVPESQVSVPGFWEQLGKTGGSRFLDSVDFVGHNFYIDVFNDKSFSLDEVSAATEHTLRELREKSLKEAGIPFSVPIRVTENGWPTGKNPIVNMERPFSQQAKVLETVIRTVHRLHNELNISHYVLFGLRDADSSKEDLFHQFGIMYDDYSPKPAYHTFQTLIRDLGA